jgi:hypothetical protein
VIESNDERSDFQLRNRLKRSRRAGPSHSSLGAFLGDAPRRLEDIAGQMPPRAFGPGERLYNQPPQSRIANTTIVVIAI